MICMQDWSWGKLSLGKQCLARIQLDALLVRCSTDGRENCNSPRVHAFCVVVHARTIDEDPQRLAVRDCVGRICRCRHPLLRIQAYGAALEVAVGLRDQLGAALEHVVHVAVGVLGGGASVNREAVLVLEVAVDECPRLRRRQQVLRAHLSPVDDAGIWAVVLIDALAGGPILDVVDLQRDGVKYATLVQGLGVQGKGMLLAVAS